MEDNLRIAILGNGAREAAMTQSLLGEGVQILAIGEKINPQIARMVRWNIATSNPLRIVQLLEDWKAELAVIGSEKYFLPIGARKQRSLVNILESEGIAVVAPTYLPSLIELDKAWMVKLLVKYGMEKYLPESRIFKGTGKIRAACDLINLWQDVAVKPAGLTGGKGVKVTGEQLKNKKAAEEYAAGLLSDRQTIVIQRKMTGREFSVQGFVDAYGFIAFAPPVMDYKKLYDGNVTPNPNTGSMGSANDANGLFFVSEAYLKQAQNALRLVILAIEEETGIHYKGFIYGQFMLTFDGRLVLIEINARLGDPEAMNILPLLKQKIRFTDICLGIVNGTLSEVKIKFKKEAEVVKYVVPYGYALEKNPKTVLLKLQKTNLPVEAHFGGVKEDYYGNLLTTGSRAVAVRAGGKNIPEAAATTNDAIRKIFVDCLGKLHWRPGIGLEPELE